MPSKLKQYVMAVVMQKDLPNGTRTFRLLMFGVKVGNMDEAKGAAIRLANEEIKKLFNEEGYSMAMCNGAHVEAFAHV